MAVMVGYIINDKNFNNNNLCTVCEFRAFPVMFQSVTQDYESATTQKAPLQSKYINRCYE